MAIVTGDRYLDSLVRFVERNAEPLLEGNLTLKLNPVGLHYVQCRLEALQELERLLTGAPVDYLRAYVSDLGDHRALEQLRRILRLLTSLKVISVLAPPFRDPTPLSLLPFGSLRVLELRGCDLSSSTVKGLLELRHTLEKLVCHNSTNALRHVFASRLVDIKDSPAWEKLSFVSCSCNELVLMDESLQLLPAVETLDLSRNHFAKLDNLRKCTKLSHLDLGFNHLRTVASLSEVSCPIVKLVLRNNALTTLRGIESLQSVEALDLSYNILSTFSELEILASLPSLHSVWLEGNPICSARWYRGHFFSVFSLPEKVKLDEQGISRMEYWERHVIIAGRRKRPAGYGFYFPAKEITDERNRISATRKKIFRVVSIQDDQKRRPYCTEVDKESTSCDTDNQMEGNGKSEEESELKGPMNRVEHMKKERAVPWLRDFRELIDLSVDVADTVGSSSNSNGKPSKFNKHIKGLLQTPKLDNIIEEEYKLHKEVQNLVSVGLNGSLDLIVGISEDKDDCKRSGSLTSIEEMISSRQSPFYPVSPPHYQKDILHSRQNLEKKFLQLSAETFSLTSSESDTSSSDDDSCESIDSCHEQSQLFKKGPMRRIMIEKQSDCKSADSFASNIINQGFEDWIKGKCKADSENPRMSCLERSNSLLDRDAQIERYFLMNLADSRVSESCQDLTCCDWISEEPGYREREVAVLQSTNQKVYVLLIDETYKGLGMISRVVGCYKFQEIEEIIVGLESQAVRSVLKDGNSKFQRMASYFFVFRVKVKGDVSHIFLTRSTAKLEKLLFLFHVCDPNGCMVKCWEQIQVGFFDKYICGGLRLSIFLYAMLLLFDDDGEGMAWISRSLFLVEGYLFLCIENAADFGKSEEYCAKNPYYLLDSCRPIEGISEMVIEGEESKCVTLFWDPAQSGKNKTVGSSITDCFHDLHHYGQENRHLVSSRWRLRWPSQETLLRFVDLVRALHSEVATSLIRVEFSSSP